MTIRGIDVSSHNGAPFNGATEASYQVSDFVIAKTTQGTGYVNPCANYAIDRAKADGKLWGFYHYAGGGDARAEADYFHEHSKDFFGQGIPVLDWEGYQNAAWGSRTWCREFVDRIHELTGVWCMVYTGLEGCVHAANCADVCALWFAGYPVGADSWDVPSFPYTIPEPWSGYTIWQFTSGGGVDRNVSPLDAGGWMRIATGGKDAPMDARWKYDDHGWWYEYADGSYPKETWKEIDGKWYLFDRKGYACEGWQKDGGSWYYMEPAPHCWMRTGWLRDGGAWYFLDWESGRMAASTCLNLDGRWYAFGGDGRLLTPPKTDSKGALVL